MKKLQKIIAMIALVAAIVTIFAACGTAEEGEKSVTVTVVYKDGTSKDFTYETTATHLGPLLRDEGLVTGHYDGGSFFIDAVDGVTADFSVDQGWWQVFEGEEASLQGVDKIALADGATYKLVYTVGF